MSSRLYFPATTAAPVTPANNGTWEYTAGSVNRKLERAKTNTALADGSAIGPWNPTDHARDRRYVSDPLAAQLISGSMKSQIMMKEIGATNDVLPQLEVYVVSGDGATVRGTLLPIYDWGPGTTLTTNAYGPRNKTVEDGKKLNGVFCRNGDRLVVVIGYKAKTGLGNTANARYGDPTATADLPEDETTTTDLVPWVEFSKDLIFLQQADPGLFETTTDKTIRDPLLTPVVPQTAVPYEGIDERLLLVRPSGSPARGYTFANQRILDGKYQRMEWWYYRNGGCGPFRLHLREKFAEQDIALLEGWEIHVQVKLPNDIAYTTWYRGVIRYVSASYGGNEILTEIRGYGYVEQLNLIQVQKTYPKGMSVSDIVNDIIDRFIKPGSRIVRPSDLDPTEINGVDVSNYQLVGGIHFECSALKALKFLAELQGDREFGVDERRAIYFRNNVNAGTVKSFYLERDPINLVGGGKGFDRLNQIKVEGKQFTGREMLRIRSDPTDVTNYGLFEKPFEIPWVTNDADADRWADKIIAQHEVKESWKAFVWKGIDKRLDAYHPMGKVYFYGFDTCNEKELLSVGKIQYVKGGWTRRGEVKEQGHVNQQTDIHQPVLTATVYLGIWQRDLVEELERNVYDPISAIQGKLRQFRNPASGTIFPSEGRVVGEPFALIDPTNQRSARYFWDATEWVPQQQVWEVGSLPLRGEFLGQEASLNAAGKGSLQYWAGNAWRGIVYAAAGFTGFTQGSIPFGAADGSLTENNAAISWDNTNKRLGIGTNNPQTDLQIGNGSGNPTLRINGFYGLVDTSMRTTFSNGPAWIAFDGSYSFFGMETSTLISTDCAFGYGALNQMFYPNLPNSGDANTAFGNFAGFTMQNGVHNVFIGFKSGYLSTGSGNTFLGFQAGYNETGSNKLYIANSSTTTPLIGGDFSAATLTFTASATISQWLNVGASTFAATQGQLSTSIANATATSPPPDGAVALMLANTNNTVGNWVGITFSQSGGAGWTGDAAGIFGQIQGRSGGNRPCDLVFFTPPVGGTALERMRIAGSGATTINQWLNVGTATAAVALGDFAAGQSNKFLNWASGQFTISANVTSVRPAFRNTSTGNTANDIGLEFYLQNGAGSAIYYGSLLCGSNVITAGNEQTAYSLLSRNNGVFYTAMKVIGTSFGFGQNATSPRRTVDILDAANPQLRLTFTDNSVYTDLQTSSAGQLTFTPTGGVVQHVQSSSGGALDIVCSNTSNTANSAARIYASVQGALALDPYFAAVVQGVVIWSWGTRNSGNSFKICKATGLGSNDWLTVDPNANIVLNNAALATNATDGFLYIAGSAGTPTGVPTAFTGRYPEVYDSTNDRFYFYNTSWKYIPIGPNWGFGITTYGGGSGVLAIANATTDPTTNPTGGGILYASGGAGKWRGSGGTVTTFGPAEPHCPTCGTDFMHEWENVKYGYLAVCMNCMARELGDRPWILRKKTKLVA